MAKKEHRKILFVLNSQEYFRNYIDSQALLPIKKDCIFLVSNNITDQQIAHLGKNKVMRYQYPPHKTKLHWHLFNINTKKFMGQSKTFKFRFARLPRRLGQIYTLAAMPFVYFLIKFIILSLTHDKKLVKIIKGIKPDLILLPSSGYEGITFEIIKIARSLKFPTLMLIDNWDNLCSKTILTRKPDFMAVWGKQTKEHAIRIHGMDKDRVFVLGTPRFIQYFKTRHKKIVSPYPFTYALFAGNALAFDELTTLKELDRLIEKNKQDLTIIYRPHPWRHPRRCADTFFDYDFKHVKLDSQAREYYKRDLGENYSPPLSYYPKLLANMQFMICPLSTMLIEGLLFGKKVFVLTYDDGIHFTSPKNAYKYYEHFRSIDRIKDVFIIDDISKLVRMFKIRKEQNIPNQDINLEYFITSQTQNYSKNLQQITYKILKHK